MLKNGFRVLGQKHCIRRAPTFLFSGTCFYENEEGFTQIAQISWSKETRFRLPVNVWRQMMDSYYPNSAWLNLRRDTFDKLQKYKTRNGIPSWEKTFERLLAQVEKEMIIL